MVARSLPLFLGLFALASAQLNQTSNVDYNVINLLNETHTMGVIVDNVTYRLSPKEEAPILYTGSAPAAKSGYRYVKITKENNNTEVEPFLRQPAKSSTPNEFFNRSWNKRDLAKLPVLYEPLDPINRISSDLHIDGQIPTIHFTGNQTLINAMHKNISSDADVKGNLTYISLNDTLTYENVEISLAGRSSRWMPKLSYNIKLTKKDRIYDYRKFKLRALATDPSYLREQLAYDSLKSVGLLSAEFTFCRVFMNDQELGLFGLIDTFQDPWLSNVFNGGETYKNGYLYQGSFQTLESGKRNQISDLSYTSNISDYGLGQYSIKVEASNGEKDNYEPLMEFTKFIAEAPTNTSNAVEEWNKKLYTDSFLRSLALEVLNGYSDGYSSMADNYYVYQEPETGKFFYISSDMDMTIGSSMFSLDDMYSGNYSTFPGFSTRPLTEKILQVPEFRQQYEDLLVNFTKHLINPVVMNDRINNLTSMLEEDVAWDKTLPRVGINLLGELASQMTPNTTNTTNSVMTNAVGSTMPGQINMTVATDFASRLNASIPFQQAVNGPTGHISLAGIKEWMNTQSSNTLKFYNTTL